MIHTQKQKHTETETEHTETETEHTETETEHTEHDTDDTKTEEDTFCLNNFSKSQNFNDHCGCRSDCIV